MIDQYGRKVTYMRISITDRCNYRCLYCMPAGGVQFLPQEEVLSYEEILRVIDAAAQLGIHRIRVTGGEPLVRHGVMDFLYRIKQEVPAIDDLAVSTNGHLLEPLLPDMKSAGVDRFNISLDSLNEERFTAMTRYGKVAPVKRAIVRAVEMGFDPVKVNAVVVRGFNDDELLDFVRWSTEMPVHVRFIEMMPFSASQSWEEQGLVPAAQMRERIMQAYALQPLVDGAPRGAGPARYWQVPGAPGTVGFISAVTECFCSGCNRIRLSCDGKINPCLGHIHDTDLKPYLRAGADRALLTELVAGVIGRKPKEHHFDDPEYENILRMMSAIGG